MYKNILTVFFIFVSFIYVQAYQSPTYVEIRKNYENYKKNDARALPYVNQYIQKAKKESDFAKLVQGYRDAVEFSPSKYTKLIYADSTIYAALASKDSDLISVAYIGKGIIYYFNFMKFKPALDEYVKAYQYAKNSKDEYHKHKILYHLGVVKNYLGYYEEAIEHFNACIQFFEQKTKEDAHPILIYNYKRGYLNSLHQIIISYGNHEKHKELSKSDSIANIGLSATNGSENFALERNYFLKSKGIINFYRDNYDGSISYLNQSLPGIIKTDDFEWVSIIYFYLGRSYLESDTAKAIIYFQKVDSVFKKHHFVVPRIRSNYEYLINYYKKKKDIDRELYYTKQLLKADSLISKDWIC